MKKVLKIILVILGVALVSTVFIMLMIGNAFTSSCGDGWQQRRLDELHVKQESTINTSEEIISSTRLLSDSPDQSIQRSDTKAAGDCIDGSPATVYLGKQLAVVGSVKDIRDKVASSLASQGYAIDAWQVSGGCGDLGPHAYAQKSGVEVQIRINRQDVPCSDLNKLKDEELWNLPAESITLDTKITSLGFSN